MKTLQRLHLSLTLATLALALGTTALHAAIGDIAVTNDPYSAVSVTANTPLTVADPAAGAIKGGAGTTVSTAVLRITTNESTNRRVQVSQTGVPTGATLTVELGTYTTTKSRSASSPSPARCASSTTPGSPPPAKRPRAHTNSHRGPRIAPAPKAPRFTRTPFCRFLLKQSVT